VSIFNKEAGDFSVNCLMTLDGMWITEKQLVKKGAERKIF
jgi:hypothetical protein